MPEAFLCKGMFHLVREYSILVSSIMTMYFIFKHNPKFMVNRTWFKYV